jgi:hypothetical protein
MRVLVVTLMLLSSGAYAQTTHLDLSQYDHSDPSLYNKGYNSGYNPGYNPGYGSITTDPSRQPTSHSQQPGQGFTSRGDSPSNTGIVSVYPGFHGP